MVDLAIRQLSGQTLGGPTGVLAMQGCIEPHCVHLRSLGATVVKVRSAEELTQCERLILPGGESSTMLRLLDRLQMFDALQLFVKSRPVWGVCAGAILLADEVEHPSQKSLKAIPVRATRNYYGSQLESFADNVLLTPPPMLGAKEFKPRTIAVDFIRAPLLTPLSKAVQVLADDGKNQPIALFKDSVLLTAFHTELGEDPFMHELFLNLPVKPPGQ